MRIEKIYEENVNLGNYQSAKVGIKIISDKEVTPAEFMEFSAKLGQLAKTAVRKELDTLRAEKAQEA